jgi:S-adenosylmethionine hydrolase
MNFIFILLFSQFLSLVFAASSPIALVTDYGSGSPRLATCKMAILNSSDQLTIIELANNITPYSREEASGVLAENAEYFPSSTIFVSIVDPAWKNKLNPLILKTKNDQIFIAPDNGILNSVIERFGIKELIQLDKKNLPDLKNSTAFGRDLYCPLAARISKGENISTLGKKISDYEKIENIGVEKTEDGLLGSLLYVDKVFGNVATNITEGDLTKLGYKPGSNVRMRIGDFTGMLFFWAKDFSDVPEGEPVLVINNYKKVVLAMNRRNLFSKVGSKAFQNIRIYQPLKK